MYEDERKKLSRAEFDKLDLQGKIDYLSVTDLWECISDDYNILRCDDDYEIDEEIDNYIAYNSSSWRELLGELDEINDMLNNLYPDDWIYKDAGYGPTDYRELTIEDFNEIVDLYKETETYNETFTVLNFDDVEELL
jgi:hypothetical protein